MDADARINAGGGDRTKIKLEIYKELRSQGLEEEAELLMTYDIVTRANSNQGSLAAQGLEAPFVHTVPPPSSVPKRSVMRNKKIPIITALALVFVTTLSIRLIPGIRTLLLNRMSPVVVPESHFVGEHGKNKKLIIFVHGVMGDMDNTWVNPETGASWPEMIKGDGELHQFDVFVYGYASPAMGDASSIEKISVRFVQQLKDFGFFQNYDELDFITHSMGGIVTKRMLNMLNNPAESSLLQKVHTVIYISVPSNGADIATVQSWLSQNPQFKGMDPRSASDFLQNVEGDWANMLRHRSASSPFPRTYSAYENLTTGPIMVVPQLYTSELSDERVIGFDYNHINIVKPKNRNAEVYRWTEARLLEASAWVPKTEVEAPNAQHIPPIVKGGAPIGTKYQYRYKKNELECIGEYVKVSKTEWQERNSSDAPSGCQVDAVIFKYTERETEDSQYFLLYDEGRNLFARLANAAVGETNPTDWRLVSDQTWNVAHSVTRVN